MASSLRLIESDRLAPIAWPSIAAASTQIQRRRHVKGLSARAENPAVLGNVAPLRATARAHRRGR